MYIILPHSKAQRTSQPRVQELETECCEAVSFGHDAVIATQDSTVVACTKTRQKKIPVMMGEELTKMHPLRRSYWHLMASGETESVFFSNMVPCRSAMFNGPTPMQIWTALVGFIGFKKKKGGHEMGRKTYCGKFL